jgi:hypothetical protein
MNPYGFGREFRYRTIIINIMTKIPIGIIIPIGILVFEVFVLEGGVFGSG